ESCWCFFFSSRRRHTRFSRDWSSDVCSSDLVKGFADTCPIGTGIREPMVSLAGSAAPGREGDGFARVCAPDGAPCLRGWQLCVECESGSRGKYVFRVYGKGGSSAGFCRSEGLRCGEWCPNGYCACL